MIAREHSGFGTSDAHERLHRWVRALCVVLVLVQIPFGIGLYRQAAWATDLWPLPDVRMTYIFLASIVAAIAAPLAWAAWRNELGVLRAIGFELMLGMPAVGLYLLWLASDRREWDLAVVGIMLLVFGAVWAVVAAWAGRVQLVDPRPLPGIIRASFVGFCCILIPVGLALTLQRDDVFPWRLSPANSTVSGLIFLSAALLFAWIVVHPGWAYGEMALTSFLAYDLVLFAPYLDLLRGRNDAATVSSYYGDPGAAATDNGINELSLTIYLAVLAFSALVAMAMYLWGYVARPVARVATGD
jgi:hypothetical protein